MILPLVASPPGGIDGIGYIWRFTLIQGALAILGGWLLYEATGRSRATLVAWAVLVAVSWAAVALRYDLWPVLCVLVAILVVERHPGAAGVALGLGAMLKLYPIALLPVLGAYALAGRDRAGFAGSSPAAPRSSPSSWPWPGRWPGPESLEWLTYKHKTEACRSRARGRAAPRRSTWSPGYRSRSATGSGRCRWRQAGSAAGCRRSPIAMAGVLGIITPWLQALRLSGGTTRGSVACRPRASTSRTAAVIDGAARREQQGPCLSAVRHLADCPFVILLPPRIGWPLVAVMALSTAVYTAGLHGTLTAREAPMIAVLLVRNVLQAVVAVWLVVDLDAGLTWPETAARDRTGTARPAEIGPPLQTERGPRRQASIRRATVTDRQSVWGRSPT